MKIIKTLQDCRSQRIQCLGRNAFRYQCFNVIVNHNTKLTKKNVTFEDIENEEWKTNTY